MGNIPSMGVRGGQKENRAMPVPLGTIPAIPEEIIFRFWLRTDYG
jgi:hypothetical protein